MDRKDMDFARIWARRYIREHRPYGLDESDVENMILRKVHYNKDKGERGHMVVRVRRQGRMYLGLVHSTTGRVNGHVVSNLAEGRGKAGHRHVDV